MSNDDTTMNLVAQFAVLEQLMINITQFISNDYEQPSQVRQALIADLRQRFRPQTAHAADPHTAALFRRASAYLDTLEPRVIGSAPDQTRQ